MVRTGARAAALETLLSRAGVEVASERPAPARLEALPTEIQGDLLELYRTLGGQLERPSFRPGAWDLALSPDLVIELDEELHFNRYRAETLGRSWCERLPWHQDYLTLCRLREQECLAAGAWGKRWTNPSCEVMFGPAGQPGDLTAAGGASRWKQRALYDAIKDAHAAAGTGPRIVRISVHDQVAGASLNAVLDGRSTASSEYVMALVRARTA